MKKVIIYSAGTTPLTSYVSKSLYRLITLAEFTERPYKIASEYMSYSKVITAQLEKDLDVSVTELYIDFHSDVSKGRISLFNFAQYLLLKQGEEVDLTEENINTAKGLFDTIGRLDMVINIGFEGIYPNDDTFADFQKVVSKYFNGVKF